MGGRGVAKRLEAAETEERAKGWATLNRGSFPWPGLSLGTKTRSRGQWGCLCASLRFQGVRHRKDFLVCFVLKQQGLRPTTFSTPEGGLHRHTSQTDFSEFVFLTHWKPHGSEKIHLTCWGLLSRNVSSDCCVNTATLSKLPSQCDGVICQRKNTTQAGGGENHAWFKGRLDFQLDKAIP